MTADTITIATAPLLLLLLLLLSSPSPQPQAAASASGAGAGAGGVVRASPSSPSSATNNNNILRGGGGGGGRWSREDIENENNDRRRRRRRRRRGSSRGEHHRRRHRRRDRRRGLYAWQTATPYADPDALCGSGATGYRATRDCSGFVYCLNGYLMVSGGGIVLVQMILWHPSLFVSVLFFFPPTKNDKLNTYTSRQHPLPLPPLPPHFVRDEKRRYPTPSRN